MKKARIAFSFVVLSSSLALAAPGRGLFGFVGGGVSQFNVLTPSQDFKLNPGSYFTLEGEKAFNGFGLYFLALVSYGHASGSANYSYTNTASANSYAANNVSLVMDKFGVGLGLRLKFVETGMFRPYIAGGGMGDYFQVTYDSASLKTPAVVGAGNDFKTIEGVLEFGIFCEAGIETTLTNTLGARLSGRYTDFTTRPLDTINKRTLRYTENIFLLSLIFDL